MPIKQGQMIQGVKKGQFEGKIGSNVLKLGISSTLLSL